MPRASASQGYGLKPDHKSLTAVPTYRKNKGMSDALT